MQTALGTITHRYWWDQGIYFRQALRGGPVETWNSQTWA